MASTEDWKEIYEHANFSSSDDGSASKDEVPQPGSLWKHYKGGEYQVFGVGLHTETGEKLVLCYNENHDSYYARPLEIWNQPTEQGTPRFVQIA